MEVNTEALKAYYADLIAKREAEIAEALVNKDFLVQQKLDELKLEVAEQVEKDIVAEIESKYAHDIELCEKFFVEDEVQEEEPTAEIEQIAVEG